MSIAKQFKERINQDINAFQVRVIDENGNALGVMPTHEALRIAQSRSLDLVEITAAAKPPVCKIVDFGKYNYEKQKKEKSQKKNQVVMTVKEIRFNANTDTHDIDFKTKHLRQFIIDGHKVKTSVLYKGRMITHPEIGEKLMNEVLEKLTDIAKIESPPKLEGKMLTTYLVPDKHKVQSYKARLAKEQKMREQAEKMQGDKPAAEQHPEQPVEPPAEETKDNGKQ